MKIRAWCVTVPPINPPTHGGYVWQAYTGPMTREHAEKALLWVKTWELSAQLTMVDVDPEEVYGYVG